MSQVLDSWLKAVQLKGNPFATKEADGEKEELLVDYFVPHPYFHTVLGRADEPKTAFLFAARGCGKSANRKVIDHYCREGKVTGKALSVPYLESSLLIERAGRDLSKITCAMHVSEIIKQAIKPFLTLLQREPETISHIYPGDVALLKWYIVNYSDILSPYRLNHFLRESGLISDRINATILQRALQESESAFLESVEEIHRPFVAFLTRLIREEPAEAREEVSASDLLQDFADLARAVGIDALYVLVDRVDEVIETAADANVGAALLEPLVANLHLMEMPGIAFKFFLPSFMAKEVMSKLTIRLDRLIFREIKWSEKDLLAVLQRRLATYCFLDPPFDSLEAISNQPELSGIDRMLVKYARGSPRNLFRLGELLFEEHCRLAAPDQVLLNRRDLDDARERFEQELERERARKTRGITEDIQLREKRVMEDGEISAVLEKPLGKQKVTEAQAKPGVKEEDRRLPSPRLALEDQFVWVDGDKKYLPDNLLKLFAFLYENQGKVCSREEIMVAVYGEEATYGRPDSEEDKVKSEAALDRLVRRLREEIEPDPRNPIFIKTARGKGFWLDTTTSPHHLPLNESLDEKH